LEHPDYPCYNTLAVIPATQTIIENHVCVDLDRNVSKHTAYLGSIKIPAFRGANQHTDIIYNTFSSL
jgi:hypothetical protein